MVEPQISTFQRLDFQDLMLFRVHEILLVASPYDSFILEEEGRLTEQILSEYLGMNISYAPRVWRADTGAAALELLSKRKFDLIIVMMRIVDIDPLTFGHKVKELYPKKPVILLAFDESEIHQLPEVIPTKSIDKIFIWAGNANVFPAIFKYIEDKKNASRDITKGDVRAIIIIEDNPRVYSVILPMIYKEIIDHTRHLVSKSLTDAYRLLHLRGRPKILLVRTYEEADKYYKRFGANILGIISDIRFPKKGKLDSQAGILFSKHIRKIEPSIPIMLQSSDSSHAQQAKEIKVHFLHKKSDTLLQEIREFIINNFGFGDFIFRNPKGEELSRATDLISLQKAIAAVPDESLTYHAASNHFSNWLAARGEFDIASIIRPWQLEDFESVSVLRSYLIDAITDTLESKQKSHIVEFFHGTYSQTTNFTRIASGSLGGKARGLVFANSILANSDLREKFPDVSVRIPRVTVIGTDEFDRFMDDNDLWDFALSARSNEAIEERFLSATLSEELWKILLQFIHAVHYPIAVRSSCLMEDSQYQPLAGVFATFMLPNSSQDIDIRINQLREAVVRVYASTYFQQSKALFKASARRQEEEKMAVIIQEMIGQKYGDRFYPTLSGSAQNINYYPISYMQRDEGIANIALGLGRTVAEGEKFLRFSPKYPAIIPQFYSVKATINNSQNSFYALNMNPAFDPLSNGEKGNLQAYDLSTAEDDGSLYWAGSVVSSDDNLVRDSLSYPGTRVITFAPLLKWKAFPLAAILAELLDLGKAAFGCPVEIEFAVNLFRDKTKKPEFYLLQIRPMVLSGTETGTDSKPIEEKNIIMKSSVALGNGIIKDITDIVIVDMKSLDASKSRQIASEIEQFNRQLFPDHPYILIGSGRWGSADPWLGIPVNWQQIAGAKVIVEVGQEKYPIDPSFGSHFFQNVTSMRVGYFTINHKNINDRIDLDWFSEQPIYKAGEFTSWIHFEQPLLVKIDGQTGDGIITKPIKLPSELMDEQESSGI